MQTTDQNLEEDKIELPPLNERQASFLEFIKRNRYKFIYKGDIEKYVLPLLSSDSQDRNVADQAFYENTIGIREKIISEHQPSDLIKRMLEEITNYKLLIRIIENKMNNYNPTDIKDPAMAERVKEMMRLQEAYVNYNRVTQDVRNYLVQAKRGNIPDEVAGHTLTAADKEVTAAYIQYEKLISEREKQSAGSANNNSSSEDKAPLISPIPNIFASHPGEITEGIKKGTARHLKEIYEKHAQVDQTINDLIAESAISGIALPFFSPLEEFQPATTQSKILTQEELLTPESRARLSQEQQKILHSREMTVTRIAGANAIIGTLLDQLQHELYLDEETSKQITASLTRLCTRLDLVDPELIELYKQTFEKMRNIPGNDELFKHYEVYSLCDCLIYFIEKKLEFSANNPDWPQAVTPNTENLMYFLLAAYRYRRHLGESLLTTAKEQLKSKPEQVELLTQKVLADNEKTLANTKIFNTVIENIIASPKKNLPAQFDNFMEKHELHIPELLTNTYEQIKQASLDLNNPIVKMQSTLKAYKLGHKLNVMIRDTTYYKLLIAGLKKRYDELTEQLKTSNNPTLKEERKLALQNCLEATVKYNTYLNNRLQHYLLLMQDDKNAPQNVDYYLDTHDIATATKLYEEKSERWKKNDQSFLPNLLAPDPQSLHKKNIISGVQDAIKQTNEERNNLYKLSLELKREEGIERMASHSEDPRSILRGEAKDPTDVLNKFLEDKVSKIVNAYLHQEPLLKFAVDQRDETRKDIKERYKPGAYTTLYLENIKMHQNLLSGINHTIETYNRKTDPLTEEEKREYEKLKEHSISFTASYKRILADLHHYLVQAGQVAQMKGVDSNKVDEKDRQLALKFHNYMEAGRKGECPFPNLCAKIPEHITTQNPLNDILSEIYNTRLPTFIDHPTIPPTKANLEQTTTTLQQTPSEYNSILSTKPELEEESWVSEQTIIEKIKAANKQGDIVLLRGPEQLLNTLSAKIKLTQSQSELQSAKVTIPPIPPEYITTLSTAPKQTRQNIRPPSPATSPTIQKPVQDNTIPKSSLKVTPSSSPSSTLEKKKKPHKVTFELDTKSKQTLSSSTPSSASEITTAPILPTVTTPVSNELLLPPSPQTLANPESVKSEALPPKPSSIRVQIRSRTPSPSPDDDQEGNITLNDFKDQIGPDAVNRINKMRHHFWKKNTKDDEIIKYVTSYLDTVMRAPLNQINNHNLKKQLLEEAIDNTSNWARLSLTSRLTDEMFSKSLSDINPRPADIRVLRLCHVLEEQQKVFAQLLAAPEGSKQKQNISDNYKNNIIDIIHIMDQIYPKYKDRFIESLTPEMKQCCLDYAQACVNLGGRK